MSKAATGLTAVRPSHSPAPPTAPDSSTSTGCGPNWRPCCSAAGAHHDPWRTCVTATPVAPACYPTNGVENPLASKSSWDNANCHRPGAATWATRQPPSNCAAETVTISTLTSNDGSMEWGFMLARDTTRLPSAGTGFVFEPKWDGLRCAAILASGRTRVESRTGRDITMAFPELEDMAASVEASGDVALDGELVVLDKERADFNAVNARSKIITPERARRAAHERPATFAAFDVLAVDGQDVRGRPLSARRELLEKLRLSASAWVTSPMSEDPDAMTAVSLTYHFEGVLAKKSDSVYVAGRSPWWLKRRHQRYADVIVGGFTSGRKGITVLVGTPDHHGGLDYRGRVHHGVNTIPDLRHALEFLTSSICPFNSPFTTETMRRARWTTPVLPVEVVYGATTPTGRLRHPRLIRVRTDLL